MSQRRVWTVLASAVVLSALIPLLALVRAEPAGRDLLPNPSTSGVLIDELAFVAVTRVGNGPPLVLLEALALLVLLMRQRFAAAIFITFVVGSAEVVTRVLKLLFVAPRPPSAGESAALEDHLSAIGVPVDIPTTAVVALLGLAIVLSLAFPWRKWGVLAALLALATVGVDWLAGRLIPLGGSNESFPSGHALTSMALACSVALVGWSSRRWRWPIVLAAVVYVLAVGLSRLYLGVHYPADVLAGWCAATAWTLLWWMAWPRLVALFEDRLGSRRRGSHEPAGVGSG